MNSPEMVNKLMERIFKQREEDNKNLKPIKPRSFKVTQDEYDAAIAFSRSSQLLGYELFTEEMEQIVEDIEQDSIDIYKKK